MNDPQITRTKVEQIALDTAAYLIEHGSEATQVELIKFFVEGQAGGLTLQDVDARIAESLQQRDAASKAAFEQALGDQLNSLANRVGVARDPQQ